VAEPFGECLPVRLRVHPGVTNENGPPEFPAPQAVLHVGHRRRVDRIAGKHPGADRQPVPRQRQAHYHLRLIPAPFFVVAPLAQRRERRVTLGLTLRVFVIHLKVHTGRIPEDEVHISPEEIGGAKEDLALDGLDMSVEEIQREVQVVQRQRRGLWEVGSLREPVLIARQLGQGLGEAVRYHREERQLMGRTTGAARLQAPQDLANAQFLPQRPCHMDDPQRPSPLDVDGLAGGADLWRDVDAALTHTIDAPGEAQKRFTIQGVGAAKVVDDVGGGAPLGRVPARLGELVVLYGGTVFVVAFGRSQIHAYTIDILYNNVKRFLYIRVSMFCGRIGEAPLDFPCFSVLSWPMCALAPQTRAQGLARTASDRRPEEAMRPYR